MRKILTSWKEIAAYLGKGVRTVQRWEIELQLPVRRPQGRDRQIVVAFTDELDNWVSGPRTVPTVSPTQQFVRACDLTIALAEQIARLTETSRKLAASLACNALASVPAEASLTSDRADDEDPGAMERDGTHGGDITPGGRLSVTA